MFNPDNRVEIEPARSADPLDDGKWMVRVMFFDQEGLPTRTTWMNPDEARDLARMLIGMFSQRRTNKTRARKLARDFTESADRVENLRVLDRRE
ncbi:hypothetical protein BBK14_01870 [Parafrankia soli]|uniref:Uncharacterized protein n=1 Tax=Parafrankia soli TaxID=2599596 RepID=A0A1S1RLD0_9ACTN|nr:hypothetical protein [Parafrankia soli]OHV46619.1 hypothetical protein BBK14_01870 [Parafrankia soli]